MTMFLKEITIIKCVMLNNSTLNISNTFCSSYFKCIYNFFIVKNNNEMIFIKYDFTENS